MNKQPLISVIVPCYNVESYLPKCVDSILEQSYKNLEVILVDDGSLDNCGDICDDYAINDNRIRVIHKMNGGLADARNVAIEIAQGEYLTFVDSDDYIADDYIETLYNLVTNYKCKVAVACHKSVQDGTEANLEQHRYEEMVFGNMEGIEKMFYQEKFDTTAWCKMYHRSLFETGIRYPFGLLYEDLTTTYRLFMQADRIAFCNRTIYYYLLRKNSIEGQPFKPKKLESALTILDDIQSHADELRPIEKAVRCRLLSFCLHILLEMPAGYPDKRKQVLIDYVKSNRWKVIMDKRARKKARVGAVVSYLGLGITRKLLNIVKERKQS